MSAEEAQQEWRERIGVRVMHAMTCTHDGDDFGPGAVCVTCFANTQRIGALMERERAAVKAEALREYADLASSREHHMTAPHFRSSADGRERNVWNLVKQELNQRANDLSSKP